MPKNAQNISPQSPGICANALPHLKCQKTCRHNWHIPTSRAPSKAADSKAEDSKAAEAEPMFQGRPSQVYYEGVLALLSKKGA
jgi:hypothetical protein